jgi:TonB family protein
VSGKWRDYYAILGVRHDATKGEIKEAWIFGVKAFHPDKFAGSSDHQQAVAQERTKAVNEAYYILSDATRRANYNREYARRTRAETTPPPRATPPPPPPRATPPPEPTKTASSANASAYNNTAQRTQARKTHPRPEQNRNESFPAAAYGAALYVPWLIAAAMLVSAAVEKHPYSFYILLRWICCAIFAWSAFIAHEKQRPFWVWGFGALAALYNPIVLVHLNRGTWISVNWFTVGAITVAAIAFLPRRAQIWVGATAAFVFTSVGLWQLQRVAQPRRSPTPTSAQSSLRTPIDLSALPDNYDADGNIVHKESAESEQEFSPPVTGETTWRWLQRNHLQGMPGNHSMELEPNQPLVASHPFAKPRPGDTLFDAKKESDLGNVHDDGGMSVRLYRRGVFAGYDVVKKVVADGFDPDNYLAEQTSSDLNSEQIPRAIPRAIPVAPSTPPITADSQSRSPFDLFEAPTTGTTPVAASSATEPPANDSILQRTSTKPKLVYAPHPGYPPKADKMHATGSGRFKITFDQRGNTKSVEIVQSTGNGVLDSNTIETLKLWRSAPGSASSVIVPIDYRQKQQSRLKGRVNASQPYQSVPAPQSATAPLINPNIPR